MSCQKATAGLMPEEMLVAKGGQKNNLTSTASPGLAFSPRCRRSGRERDHSPSQFQADFFLERSAAHNQPRLRKETTLRQACPSECRRAQCAFKDSMLHGSCNSHYVSQFAAFFIDARTKRSGVESFESLVRWLSKNYILHSVVCVCVQPRPD